MVFGRRKPALSNGSVDDTQSSRNLLHEESKKHVGEEDKVEQAPKQKVQIQSSPQPISSKQQLSDNYKFGILERLNEAVASKMFDSASYRSPDLIPLMKGYDTMRKKLRLLISLAKKYHQSMLTLDFDRMEVC
jgi:hypothetical protein